MNNMERVDSAHKALEAFGSYDPEDKDTSLADLLANLLHWADAHGIEFDEALSRGADYHLHERIREKLGRPIEDRR